MTLICHQSLSLKCTVRKSHKVDLYFSIQWDKVQERISRLHSLIHYWRTLICCSGRPKQFHRN